MFSNRMNFQRIFDHSQDLIMHFMACPFWYINYYQYDNIFLFVCDAETLKDGQLALQRRVTADYQYSFTWRLNYF